jgi:hypothetical protein
METVHDAIGLCLKNDTETACKNSQPVRVGSDPLSQVKVIEHAQF